jgi:hypothetical protein
MPEGSPSCRLRDPVPARQICRLGSGLVLPRHRDDLLFRTPCSLHQSVGAKAGLILQLEEKFGQFKWCSPVPHWSLVSDVWNYRITGIRKCNMRRKST